MSTPVKDPFDDLLDLSEPSEPPPPPTSLPPEGDDDFKSATDDDLFGSHSGSLSQKSSKEDIDIFSSSSTKAHGSTFDDLFCEGTSSKKAKKAPASHGATFDDLFGEESHKFETSHGTTFKDIFGEDAAKSKADHSTVPTSSPSSRETQSEKTEDLFAADISKSERVLSDWDAGKELDELFGSGKPAVDLKMSKDLLDDDLFGTGMKTTEKSSQEASVDIFGGTAVKSKPRDIPVKEAIATTEELLIDSDDLFGSGTNKDGGKTSQKSAEATLDDIFGQPVVRSRPRDIPSTKPPESAAASLLDTFDSSEKTSNKDSSLLLDIFGPPLVSNLSSREEPCVVISEDTPGDLIKQAPVATQDEFGFDDLFGSKSSTNHSAVDDKTSNAADATAEKNVVADKAAMANSDLDLLCDVTRTSTASGSAAEVERGKTDGQTSDQVDGTGDIVVSSAGADAKTSESENAADIDFTVIEDTSLLDLNLSRHKTSLRKHGSLARRKRPTRSSMRRVIHTDDDIFTTSSSGADVDREDNDGDRGDDAGRVEDHAGEERTPVPQKTSSVTEGRMLISPNALAQSQLMKGIVLRKNRQDSGVKNEEETSTNQSTALQNTPDNEPSIPIIDNGEVKKPKVNVSPKNKLFGSFKPEDKTKDVMTAKIEQEVANSQPTRIAKVNNIKPESTSPTSSNTKPTLSNKPTIKTAKPKFVPRSKPSSGSDNPPIVVRPVLKPAPVTMATKNLTSSKDNQNVNLFSTALKPISPNVPEKTSTDKNSSVILEKVTLRSTKGTTGEVKVTSSTSENDVINPDLAERKILLRKVTASRNESGEVKGESKSEPSWVKEMKRRSLSRGSEDGSPIFPESESPASKKSVDESFHASETRIREADRSDTRPQVVRGEKPTVSPEKPRLSQRPVIGRPKPKEEAKPHLNGRDTHNKPSDGGKEIGSVPSWKRELSERNKKKKVDPVTATTHQSESPPEVAVTWRSQLSQKRKKPPQNLSDVKNTCDEAKQPSWALEAEQRRARIAKSGILGQK